MLGIPYRKSLSWVLCFLLALVTMPLGSGAGVLLQVAGSMGSSDYSGQGAPLSEDEVEGLLAPVALYPDALVAPILNAATFPDQVTVADNWLQHNKNLTGTALVQAVNGQSWDPGVKALTQFPLVLNNMAQNLAWTSELGEAYHNQQSQVTNAVQLLRAKAQAAGNLKSTSQMRVIQQTPDVIVIQPVNPGVVYVPVYNPTLVYGTPVQTPGYSMAAVVATGLLSFGAGVAVGALMSGGCCEWGWSGWNYNWYHGGAYYHGYPYHGNNAWHGGYYGGYNYYGNHTYHNSYDYNHPYNAYQSAAYHNDNNDGYNHTGGTNSNQTTNVSGNPGNGNRGADASSFDRSSGGWASSGDARGWGQSSGHSDRSTAFSSWGDHSGSSGFDSGGWGDRTASSRGWGSHGSGGGGWAGGSRTGGFRR